MKQKDLFFLETQEGLLKPTNKRLPTAPVKTSLESREILEKEGKKERYRALVYNYMLAYGPKTYDDVQVDLGLPPQTASCIVKFLADDGYLYRTGQKVRTRMNKPAALYKARKNPQLKATITKQCSRCQGTGVISEKIWKERDEEC